MKKVQRQPLYVIIPVVLVVSGVVSGLVALGLFRLVGQRPVQASTQDPPPPKSPVAVTPAADAYASHIKPLLTKYCEACHNEKKMSAGISFELLKDTTSARKVKDLWEKTKELVETKQMPPKNKPQPTDAERKAIVTWIDEVATKIDCGLARDPGRPTIRRLNRNEYNNTIRDLLGVTFRPADDFPSDDVGYGFDNIGDVLSMPPILLEKYLASADKILDAAIVVERPIVSSKERFNPQNVRVFPPSAKINNNRLITFTSNGSANISYDFVHEGEYIFRAKAYGEKVGPDAPKLSFDLNRVALKTVTVEAVQGKSQLYEARTKVTAGRKDVTFVFVNPFTDKDSKQTRSLSIEHLEIEGPLNPVAKPLPETHKAIFGTATTNDRAAAQSILKRLADQAYRRPTTPDEVNRLLRLYDVAAGQNEPFTQCVKFALKGVLVSPHFLFRIERDAEPNNPNAIHPITEHELATRLSYFLWATMPDATLRGLADRGELRKPGVLEAQVKRMLQDPKANALVENFAGQWLMLRTLATLNPDRGTYRNYDVPLRDAMIKETELYFEHVMREDRSVLEFLDSNYTFVNERLARHYGINGVSGSQFKKVTLTDANRGGIVTQASVLTVTSNPTRTSPVKRGKWILENILGTPPPPPPPDVPELSNDSKTVATGSLRQRMEEHRKNPSCATCHAKMDPLGFGLENFDGVGSFRSFDGRFKIDPSGELPDGAKFSGPADLRKLLLAKGDLFRRNLAEKMLTYSLGRGMEYYDKCAIDDVVVGLKQNGDKFSAMIIAIVKNDTFQKRRGMTAK